jgi:hypothetical protein
MILFESQDSEAEGWQMGAHCYESEALIGRSLRAPDLLERVWRDLKADAIDRF